MGNPKTLALLLAALAATAAGFSPARGQCRLCSRPTTTLSQSFQDSQLDLQVETSLDFGRLILAGGGEGTAVIRPDGSNAAQGSLASLTARAMVGTAVVHGLPGRAIRVELPRSISLYSMRGGRITVDNVESDLPSLPRLDSEGTLTFRFGGRVTVSGDSEGEYRGEMPITVEYQ